MLFLGIDAGTTGTKALVLDAQGRTLGKGYQEYELFPSAGGRVEQRAEDWWNAVVYAVSPAVSYLSSEQKKKIVSLSLSTQGASMLAVDKDFVPLGPVITWMDNRASKEADWLEQQVGGETIYRKSGWGLGPDFDAAKILWINRNQPDVFKKAASFVSTLEYLNYHLTGENVIDPTNAAIRQMMDISTGKWDSQILDAIGIQENRLPKILPTGAFVGKLTVQAAEVLGLSEQVKVYNGAHDQYCAALGCGAVKQGDALLSTGTTWVLLGVLNRLLYTPSHLAPGIHPVNGLYGAMGSLVSAGCALKWYKSLVSEEYKQIDQEAFQRRESAKGLLFYPYVAGAGFPHDRSERELYGTLFGMQLLHDRYDIALALMEGVAFEARMALEEMGSAGMPMKTLLMLGGAAKSLLWSRITGAVTGCEIRRTKESEACCMGSAMLAAVGAGAFPDYISAVSSMVSYLAPLPSEPEAQLFYEEKYQRYCKNYPLVRHYYKGE